ncbi:MAG TPA: rhodanese-like domain-containing protein [Candidatus Krumholzibacteria bacterium]|nr:rhodanese-like domain-containing protein [Candidatus Krumholzibacteria bacterium]
MRAPWKFLAAAALIGTTMAMTLVGDPTLDDRLAWQHDQLEETLVSRDVHVHPGELLELMHDDLVRLRIVDVRDESDFNLFHLADAERVDCDALQSTWGHDLVDDAIVVITGNDEARAESAWRMLRARGVRNVYVLAGGLNRWVELFSEPEPQPHEPTASVASAAAALLLPVQTESCLSEEPFAWGLSAALGDRHPASLPDAHRLEPLDYQDKVKRTVKAPKLSGGCG